MTQLTCHKHVDSSLKKDPRSRILLILPGFRTSGSSQWEHTNAAADSRSGPAGQLMCHACRFARDPLFARMKAHYADICHHFILLCSVDVSTLGHTLTYTAIALSGT